MNKNLFDISSAASIGAAAEKLTKFSPLKKKGTPSKKAKAATKEPKAKVTTPDVPQRDYRTMGKEATHKRSADTGRVSKLTPKQKAAVEAHDTPRQFIKATPPKAIDLTDLE